MTTSLPMARIRAPWWRRLLARMRPRPIGIPLALPSGDVLPPRRAYVAPAVTRTLGGDPLDEFTVSVNGGPWRPVFDRGSP